MMEGREGAEEFGRRLKAVMEQEGITASEIARRLGTTPSVIASWINKGAMPGADYALAVSRALGVNLDWLVAGDGPIRGSVRQDEFALVDFFGPTDPVGGVKYHPKRYAFRKDWLTKFTQNPRALVCTKFPSDAMTPTVQPDDLILVEVFLPQDETAVKEHSPEYQTTLEEAAAPPIGVPVIAYESNLLTDSIYLFKLHGRMFMRRIEPATKGLINLSADNAKYRSIIITDKDAVELIVIGKVIWIGREVL